MLRALFIISFGFCVLLTGAVVIGAAVTQTDHAFALTGSDCALPCVFGITPGVTTRQEALVIAGERANLNRLATNDSIYFNVRDGDQRRVLVVLEFTNESPSRVRTIRISRRDTDAQVWRLGDLLTTGREPLYTLRECAPTLSLLYLVFGSDSEMIAMVSANRRLSPFDLLILLDIEVGQQGLPTYNRLPMGCQHLTHWHGFAPYQVYKSRTFAR
jgi:hypothetical protein